jgi:major membrane immunogen (membrane-anchored lipoprotein)
MEVKNMIKKIGILLVMLTAVFLIACSSSNDIVDGTYKAQVNDAYVETEGRGWREFLEVTFKDGKITEVTFNAINDEGKYKTDPGAYNMEPSPAIWMPVLEENIKNNEGGKIDALTGATSSSTNAQKLLDAIYKDGKPGQTIDVEISK